jgi:polysaccharide biosynthesis protein PslG
MAARCTCLAALVAALVGAFGTPSFAAGPRHAAKARPAGVIALRGVNVVNVDADPTSVADRAIEQAHALHATVVRTDVLWSTLEPIASGVIEPRTLAFMDRLVSDAAADGIRVIVLADRSPCWESSAPAALIGSCKPGTANVANDWPPRSVADYAAFVTYLAQRYGTHLAAIEIWNEPDQANEHFFAGPEKAKRYAALLKAAYAAVKAANPAVAVIGGSLVGSNGAFLRALYAEGIKGHYDGLAVHYYNLTLASVRAIHEVQLANHDHTPLWLDEFGWTSCWPKETIQQEQACVTEQAQASNEANLFSALRRARYVAAAVLYKLQDTKDEEFGALTSSGVPKPAFVALSQALTSPSASPERVRLKLRRAGRRVVASGSGPVGDYMQLEALKGTTTRYRVLFTLDRFNQFSITLPRSLGTHGLTVRVYQYWSGLQSAAHAHI